MSDLTVHSWKRHGKDRLYVNLPDGTAVAWADRATKTVTIKIRKYQDEALALLRRHLGEGLIVGSAPSPASKSRPADPTRQPGPSTPPTRNHRSERSAALHPQSQ